MRFRNLLAYQKGFSLALEIHQISKSFPAEEKYSLTDQVRRSSRSVCTNIAEGYRKRKYPKHFVSKLTDSDAENSETFVWLDFALALGYIQEGTYNKLMEMNAEVGKLISHMIDHPEKFL
jgi:four helix bundle protein